MRRRSVTADGRIEIVLRAPARRRVSPSSHTPRGRFAGPDYVVEIVTVAGRPPVRRPAAGGRRPDEPLTNQLVIAEREDVARGIRVLLADPLLTLRADRTASTSSGAAGSR